MSEIDAEHARWNEEMARRYDPDEFHRRSSPLVQLVRYRRVRAIHQLLRLHREHRVVDVGCGAGNILVELKAAERVGVDLSEFLLDKAKARLGDTARLIRAPAEELPFQDAYFDRLVCSEVLEHLRDPTVALGEMRRVLAHNGLAVVTVPNEPLINRVKQGLIRFRLFGLVSGRKKRGYEVPERMEDEWHLHEFDEKMLRDVVAPFFRIDRLVGIPFQSLPLGFACQLEPV